MKFTWAVHHLRMLNVRVHVSWRLRGHVIQTQVIGITLRIATGCIPLLVVTMLWRVIYGIIQRGVVMLLLLLVHLMLLLLLLWSLIVLAWLLLIEVRVIRVIVRTLLWLCLVNNVELLLLVLLLLRVLECVG